MEFSWFMTVLGRFARELVSCVDIQSIKQFNSSNSDTCVCVARAIDYHLWWFYYIDILFVLCQHSILLPKLWRASFDHLPKGHGPKGNSVIPSTDWDRPALIILKSLNGHTAECSLSDQQTWPVTCTEYVNGGYNTLDNWPLLYNQTLFKNK